MNGITITKKNNETTTVDAVCSISVNNDNIKGKFLIYLAIPNEVVENNLVKVYISEVYPDDSNFDGECDFEDEKWINFKPILFEIINGENSSNYQHERIVGQNFKVSNPRKPATAISEEKLNKIKLAQENSGVDTISSDLSEKPAIEENPVPINENNVTEEEVVISDLKDTLVSEKEETVKDIDNIIPIAEDDNNEQIIADINEPVIDNNEDFSDNSIINDSESENHSEEVINSQINTVLPFDSDVIEKMNDNIKDGLDKINVSISENLEKIGNTINIISDNIKSMTEVITNSMNMIITSGNTKNDLGLINLELNKLNSNIEKIVDKIAIHEVAPQENVVTKDVNDSSKEMPNEEIVQNEVGEDEIEIPVIPTENIEYPEYITSETSENELNITSENEELVVNDNTSIISEDAISKIPKETDNNILSDLSQTNVDISENSDSVIEDENIETNIMSVDALMGAEVGESNLNSSEFIINQTQQVPTDGTNFLNPFNIEAE